MEGVAILTLRRCRISGFKALHNASFALSDNLLILIGNNGAGKSSTLQAFAFVKAFLNGTPDAFFESRGWSKRDLKPQITGFGNTLRVDLLLEMDDARQLLWQMNWGFTSGNNVREIVWLSEMAGSEPRRVLSYKDGYISSELDDDVGTKGLTLKGSMLSVIEAERGSPVRELMRAISSWGAGILSLELLSPRSMREGTRGKTTDIGSRGEHLASFLAGLNASRKGRVVDRLADFYPLDRLDTTRKRAGWIDIQIAETFGIGPIGTSHVSDGFLRLLALCALPEIEREPSLILLDEIEDGIEPHILPDLIQRIINDSPSQFIMTSHSPLLVNFFDPHRVALIGRRRDGSAMTASLDRLPSVQRGIEYFGGGEMWANMASETLEQELNDIPDPMAEANGSRFSPSWARAFMAPTVLTGR